MKKTKSKIGVQMEHIKLRSSRRMALIDEVRGLAIISMVVYHFIYDMVVVFGKDWQWFFGNKATIWQSTTAIVFILVAGICTQYTGRAYIRAFKVCGCAMLITAATYFVFPEQLIIFGILHFIGAAMLTYALFRKLLVKINPWPGFIVSVVFTAITWNISQGIIGIGEMTVRLPDFIYGYFWLFPLGITSPGFFSADYYPLFPYLFIFMAGSYMGCGVKRLSEGFSREHVRSLCFIGKHSLLIYMTHQVIIFGVLTLVFRLLNVLS